jgi:hypothetical protein
MREAGGEEPQIALADVSDEITPAVVGRINLGAPREHDRPLALLMPVQLAYRPGLQSHLDAGERRRNGQLLHVHLTRPSAVEEVHVRIAHREFEVRQQTCVGARWCEQVGILPVDRVVDRPGNRSAIAAANRFWDAGTRPRDPDHAGGRGGRRAPANELSAVKFGHAASPVLTPLAANPTHGRSDFDVATRCTVRLLLHGSRGISRTLRRRCPTGRPPASLDTPR